VTIGDFKASLDKALQDTELEVEKKFGDSRGKAREFDSRWLTIFTFSPMSEGLTALAYDLLMHYIGNKEYHDHNGPLIDLLKELKYVYIKPSPVKNTGKASMRGGKNNVASYRRELTHSDIVDILRRIPKKAQPLFQSGSTVMEMISDFEGIIEDEAYAQILAKNLQKSTGIKPFVELLDNPDYIWHGDERKPDEL